MSARPFDITAASERVRVDRDRRGEIAFTISNRGVQKCRARIVVTAVPPASAAWFALAGPAERELSPDGTDQAAFIATIPASVASGQYQMRLDVATDGAPACEGQVVTVVVEGEAAPRRAMPSWILFLIAALLGVGGAVAALITKLFAILFAGLGAATVVFVIALVLLLKHGRSA